MAVVTVGVLPMMMVGVPPVMAVVSLVANVMAEREDEGEGEGERRR